MKKQVKEKDPITALPEAEMKKLKEGKNVIIDSKGRRRVITHNTKPSMTDQSWKDETDVNEILTKYKKTGQITHVSKIEGKFADVSAVPNLHTAMQTVKEAEDEFLHLPPHIRKRFNNDLTQMVDFIKDESNRAEAIELGLVERPPEQPQAAASQPQGEPGAEQTKQ